MNVLQLSIPQVLSKKKFLCLIGLVFGLAFIICLKEVFLEIIYAYCKEFEIPANKDLIRSEALEWSITRGARSGRVAWQFVQDLAGRNKIKIRLI